MSLRAQTAARSRRSFVLFVGALALALASCLKVDFDPASVVNTVRIFATRADKPYAKPGEKVSLEMLAFDGRPQKARPMTLYWIPIPCVNPPKDLYYLCFAQFAAGGGGAGSATGASSAVSFTAGTDLTDLLPKGPTFSFTMPENAITSHAPTPGAPAPYGLAIVFNIACAGRVKLEAPGENPQSVPLGCYDDAGQKLSADDYVIGFTRVYAYADVANQNPPITNVTFEGEPVGKDGIVVDHCTKEQFKDCDEKKLGVTVPDEASEVNPLSKSSNGDPQREQVWVAYYGTAGRFGSEIRLLFDPSEGRVPDPDNKLRIPREPGTGLLWVIVRDNRGGATWQPITLTVR